jgi:hypothetical protein
MESRNMAQVMCMQHGGTLEITVSCFCQYGSHIWSQLWVQTLWAKEQMISNCCGAISMGHLPAPTISVQCGHSYNQEQELISPLPLYNLPLGCPVS